jgi:hypothetical protein
MDSFVVALFSLHSRARFEQGKRNEDSRDT